MWDGTRHDGTIGERAKRPINMDFPGRYENGPAQANYKTAIGSEILCH
jgi:hypothetical protein